MPRRFSSRLTTARSITCPDDTLPSRMNQARREPGLVLPFQVQPDIADGFARQRRWLPAINASSLRGNDHEPDSDHPNPSGVARRQNSAGCRRAGIGGIAMAKARIIHIDRPGLKWSRVVPACAAIGIALAIATTERGESDRAPPAVPESIKPRDNESASARDEQTVKRPAAASVTESPTLASSRASNGEDGQEEGTRMAGTGRRRTAGSIDQLPGTAASGN